MRAIRFVLTNQIQVRPCRATNEVRGSELIKTHELVELVTHLEVVASRLAQRPDGSAPWSAAQWHERTRGLLGESQSWAEQPEASRDYFEALAQAEAGVAQSEGQRAKLARITVSKRKSGSLFVTFDRTG